MNKLNEQGSVPEYVWGWGIGIFVILVIVLGINYAAHAIPNYNRSQRLKNENNQTQVNDIQIAQTAQLVKVQEQKAEIQVAQAKGIAESQDIIKSTLTPAYLQYEAIEAQKSEVNSQNHTLIYIPSGSNGVPLVSTVPQQ